jgi:hypothetical protein
VDFVGEERVKDGGDFGFRVLPGHASDVYAGEQYSTSDVVIVGEQEGNGSAAGSQEEKNERENG